MEDLKKIQEFFSKPLEENVDKKYSDFLVALRDSGAINMFGAAPYLQAEFGLDKREAREILANWMRSFGESLNENKVTKEDFDKVVKILSKSKYPFTIMLVPKWDEIDIITGQDSPDEITDDISQRLDSSGLNWGGNSGITISGDSSNYSRREYSDIFKVNGGHQDYFEESVNEMDINDPIMMKMRAAKDAIKNQKPDFGKEYGDAVKTAYGNDKNAKKLAFLKKERAQLMRDMEQEAEPEGGPIADEYGSKLNRIDAAIAKLSGRKEMTYDQAIAEDKGKMPTQDQVDKFFALTQNETHYLNSKPVAGQEATFNLMKIEPWDEYDLSNWNSLVRKAKTRGKSINEELNLSNYGKVTPPKGGASLVGKYNSIQGKSKYDTVIFDYQEGSDKPYGIVQVEGHGIYGSDLLKRLGLRQTRSWTAGVDVYIHDGNYNPVYVSEDDFKALLDFWSGGLDREAKAQADFYRGRGNTSGTIDENDSKESVAQSLAETIKLGEGVIEEELCPKGKAYIKRRKAAGEKSSAYLSGRAVKVCKGQMSGRKKRKSKKK